MKFCEAKFGRRSFEKETFRVEAQNFVAIKPVLDAPTPTSDLRFSGARIVQRDSAHERSGGREVFLPDQANSAAEGFSRRCLTLS